MSSGRPVNVQPAARPLVAIRVAFSIPSLIGACYIIQHVSRSPARRRGTFGRILLGMSIMDCCFAIYTLVSPLTRHAHASCQAFGFIGQGARLSTVLYNGSLAFYYLLTIRYGWKERDFRRPWYLDSFRVSFLNWERLMHIVPNLLGWGSAIVALCLELYNPTVIGCVIARTPGTPPVSQTTLKFQQMALFYGWVWLVIGFVVVAMLLIYCSISRIESRGSVNRIDVAISSRQDLERRQNVGSRDASSDSVQLDNTQSSSLVFRQQRQPRMTPDMQQRLQKRRRTFATQALLYCSVFVLTWMWSSIQLYIVVWALGRKPCTPLVYLTAIFETLAGFWNALIYIRPRYLAFRKQQIKKEQRQQQQQQQQQQQEQVGSNLEQPARTILQLRGRMEAFVQAASVVVEEKSSTEDRGGAQYHDSNSDGTDQTPHLPTCDFSGIPQNGALPVGESMPDEEN